MAAPVEDYLAASPSGERFDIIFDTGGAHSLAPLSFRGASYSGVLTLLPRLTGRAHHGLILTEAAALVEGGLLTPRLDPREFDFTSVMEACKAVETGTEDGKVVVDVAGRRSDSR